MGGPCTAHAPAWTGRRVRGPGLSVAPWAWPPALAVPAHAVEMSWPRRPCVMAAVREVAVTALATSAPPVVAAVAAAATVWRSWYPRPLLRCIQLPKRHSSRPRPVLASAAAAACAVWRLCAPPAMTACPAARLTRVWSQASSTASPHHQWPSLLRVVRPAARATAMASPPSHPGPCCPCWIVVSVARTASTSVAPLVRGLSSPHQPSRPNRCGRRRCRCHARCWHLV